MKHRNIVIVVGAFAGLSACVPSPRSLETDPVVLSTAKGDVTCQLYNPQTVLWDEAINHPDTLTIDDAHEICRTEGLRLQQARPIQRGV